MPMSFARVPGQLQQAITKALGRLREWASKIAEAGLAQDFHQAAEKAPNLISRSAYDILHKETGFGDVDAVVQILKVSPGCVDAETPSAHCSSADINARSFMGYTPLTFATESGRGETMLTLIKCRADLNAASTSEQMALRGHTPLYKAALLE
ncbi:hypothetical protein HD806DRAFT_525415 [Xylariaceae sp. AK1471]|nr:hypothetical protein HD806DRAFT_525415 [Xylariaceae sp. AK1471]